MDLINPKLISIARLAGNHLVCPANMILQIGSSAYPNLFQRERRVDTDYIMSFQEFEKFKNVAGWDTFMPTSGKNWVFRQGEDIVEVEIAWPGSSGDMLLKYCNACATEAADDIFVASLDVCLMLKLSHRYLKNSPHFLKTMKDIKILRDSAVELNEQLLEILKVREEETYSYDHPNLDRTKDEFFVDDYLFDHDSLHLAVAVDDQPAYTRFKRENSEVSLDMNKFDNLPLGLRLDAVYEEVAVLALERSVIPFGKDEQWAFEKALEKVCTSITSGRFREFAWENYDLVLEVKARQAWPYTTDFFNGIVNSTVKIRKNIHG